MKKTLFILYGISAFFYYLLMKQIVGTLDVFYEPTLYVLLTLYLVFGYTILIDNKRWQFITYVLWLATILFYRVSAVGFQLDFYLDDWLPFLFKNKVVTINVIGNILIFIPMGMYVKNVLLGFSLVTVIELLQVLVKRGMFDVVDIVLNTMGIILGVIIVWMKTRIKRS